MTFFAKKLNLLLVSLAYLYIAYILIFYFKKTNNLFRIKYITCL